MPEPTAPAATTTPSTSPRIPPPRPGAAAGSGGVRSLLVSLGPGGVAAVLWLLLVYAGPVLANGLGLPDPIANDLGSSFIPPFADPRHPLGTDELGRDLLSRVVHGGHTAVEISALSMLVATVFGATLGVFSAYLGGPLDALASRFSEMQLALPSILLGLIVLSLFGNGYLPLFVVLTLATWPLPFRVARSTVARTTSAQFVEAAQQIGVGRVRIVLRHLLPAVAPVIVTTATVEFSRNLMLVSSLNFLGLGITPPTPDWGAMIAAGQGSLAFAWWLVAAPAIALVLTVLASNHLGARFNTAARQRRAGDRP